jgi:hypothetical protein
MIVGCPSPSTSLRYCFLLFVVGGYFTTIGRMAVQITLPGILGFHDDEHVARPHLFLHAGTAPFYCFHVISTLLVDGVEKQSLVIQRLGRDGTSRPGMCKLIRNNWDLKW